MTPDMWSYDAVLKTSSLFSHDGVNFYPSKDATREETALVITKAIFKSSDGWNVKLPGSLNQALSSVPAGAKPIKKVKITGIKPKAAASFHLFKYFSKSIELSSIIIASSNIFLIALTKAVDNSKIFIG